MSVRHLERGEEETAGWTSSNNANAPKSPASFYEILWNKFFDELKTLSAHPSYKIRHEDM